MFLMSRKVNLDDREEQDVVARMLITSTTDLNLGLLDNPITRFAELLYHDILLL